MTEGQIELVNQRSIGGTETMARNLERRLAPSLLRHFQLIPSRVRGIDATRIPIYWLHDLPEGGESQHLRNGGWNRFHTLVYVSNWQAQLYEGYFGIPWHKGRVILNAIEPIAVDTKERDRVRLIYHSTPHRGLELLVPVFERLCQRYDNIELDVFSSFKLYGQEERDSLFEPLFERCRRHPMIHYHGTQPSDVVRAALARAHIFAYPSIWPETSCICLMEAMSAGCLCVHSNFGALYETAANWTFMYQFQEEAASHERLLYENLAIAIDGLWTERLQGRLTLQKTYADTFYSWDTRIAQWEQFLRGVLATTRPGSAF
jgi:glycosyltransferase involved in cell wall biosynthesis